MAKDKLNPLRTKHDIEVELDGVVYKLVYKPVNKHIQEKLNLLRNENKDSYESVDSKRFDLKGIRELISINNDLLKIDNLENRAEILLENKNYLKDITSLEKEIKKLEKDLISIDEATDKFYQQMFDECISGDEKIKFKKAIDDAGLLYTVINIYIQEAVRVAIEKK